jgi:hypothetical protein
MCEHVSLFELKRALRWLRAQYQRGPRTPPEARIA